MKYKAILWFFIGAYVLYFSWFSILRYQTLWASYFDLGIMHQTVYNTYKAFASGDWSRFLELTDPVGFAQIKRMAIHNDLTLGLLSPFYFIYNSPSTLLVIQALIGSLGAWFVYMISQKVLEKNKFKNTFSLLLVFSYLMHPALQRATIFDFHAVTLASAWLLGMFYFWLIKKYRWSLAFFLLALFSKEQVGLTTAMMGAYFLILNSKKRKDQLFGLSIVATSIIWVLLSFFVIIPYFRGGEHIAATRFENIDFFKTLFRESTSQYFWVLLGPAGLLSLFSPLQLFIAAPEFLINLLSQESNMRNIIYHYTAIIQPFIYISAIYGLNRIMNNELRMKKKYGLSNVKYFVLVYVLFMTLAFSYFKGPLPFARERDVYPILYPQKEAQYARTWSQKLQDDSIKVSSTGHLAPFFTGRRYFYTFSKNYSLADYVIITTDELRDPHSGENLNRIYQQLMSNPIFVLIEKKDKFEVYKKI